MKELECYKRVDDDLWPGAYEDKYVKILLSKLDPNGNEWRVGVWGHDDFALICDLNSYEEALIQFTKVLEIEVLSLRTLFDMKPYFKVF